MPHRNQRLRHIDPLILVLHCHLPIRIRHYVLDGLHTRQRVFDKAVEMGEFPGRPNFSDIFFKCAIQRWWRDELDLHVQT